MKAGSSARSAVALAITIGAVGCGPIDPTAAHVDDSAVGPTVLLSDTSPQASFRLVIVAPVIPDGGDPAFQLSSDDLPIASARASLLPVEIGVHRVDEEGGRSRLELHRGWCRGSRCVGTFDLTFTRARGAPALVVFDWSVAATINFESLEPPDGASIDVTISAPARAVA